MITVQNIIGHLKTIHEHKMGVMENCFRLGLYRQGLMHDLSKYAPTELFQGFKHYQGIKSPNFGERKEKGYSEAWMHHKGRNRHHIEYWNDYSLEHSDGMYPVEMPIRYVCEMMCDRISASKTYNKENYNDSKPLEYYMTSPEHHVIHPNTERLLLKLLKMLSTKGEDYTFRYMRHLLEEDRKKRKRF